MCALPALICMVNHKRIADITANYFKLIDDLPLTG